MSNLGFKVEKNCPCDIEGSGLSPIEIKTTNFTPVWGGRYFCDSESTLINIFNSPTDSDYRKEIELWFLPEVSGAVVYFTEIGGYNIRVNGDVGDVGGYYGLIGGTAGTTDSMQVVKLIAVGVNDMIISGLSQSSFIF